MVFSLCWSGQVKQTAKNFTFCWFWLGKMHWNGLSGTYLGFEACQIQWCRFQVSMISGSWNIKISGKNFTFCWFWLGKMHQNGLSGAYFRVQGMPNPMALVSSLYDKWFLKISKFQEKISAFCWKWLGYKCIKKWDLSGAYLRVQGMPNPKHNVSEVPMPKWFLSKIKNFRRPL